MDTIKITGGARIGMARASWPLATLVVTRDMLELRGGIIGNLIFSRQDIIELTPGSSLLGNSIRIEHNVAAYSNNVVFMCWESYDSVMDKIRSTGFMDSTAMVDATARQGIIERQETGSFPIKKPVAIGVVVLWNIFFLADWFRPSSNSHASPGPGTLAAVVMLFLMTVSLLVSAKARELILRKGRTLEDIKGSAWLFLFITGFMLVILTLAFFHH